jgi:hypothetical protein
VGLKETFRSIYRVPFHSATTPSGAPAQLLTAAQQAQLRPFDSFGTGSGSHSGTPSCSPTWISRAPTTYAEDVRDNNVKVTKRRAYGLSTFLRQSCPASGVVIACGRTDTRPHAAQLNKNPSLDRSVFRRRPQRWSPWREGVYG